MKKEKINLFRSVYNKFQMYLGSRRIRNPIFKSFFKGVLRTLKSASDIADGVLKWIIFVGIGAILLGVIANILTYWLFRLLNWR